MADCSPDIRSLLGLSHCKGCRLWKMRELHPNKYPNWSLNSEAAGALPCLSQMREKCAASMSIRARDAAPAAFRTATITARSRQAETI
jgi:hypothetical protein